MRMGRCSAAVAAALVLAAPVIRAEHVANPHTTAAPDCAYCHTNEIYTEDCHSSSGFCLIANSVEELCLTCHVKEECCRLGQDHQSQLFLGEKSHPSDIAVADVNPAHLPETLPIQNGRITCRTCHRHTRTDGSDYKMLRLVQSTGEKADFTELCADCHSDY